MHEESTKFDQPTTMAVIHKSYKKVPWCYYGKNKNKGYYDFFFVW